MIGAADVVVAAHFAFVVFVVLGGLLVLRWPALAWLHLPAAIWGALVELADLPCPLTSLEFALRDSGGEGGFVARLLLPLLYPDLIRPGTLTPGLRIALGSFVVLVNAAIYAWIVRKHRRKAAPAP